MPSWWGSKDLPHYHYRVDYEIRGNAHHFEYGGGLSDYDKDFDNHPLKVDIIGDVIFWLEHFDNEEKLVFPKDFNLCSITGGHWERVRVIQPTEIKIIKFSPLRCDCFDGVTEKRRMLCYPHLREIKK